MTAKRSRAEHLDDPGIADRDVEPAPCGIEEHHVGHPSQPLCGQNLPAVRVDLDQYPRITRAKEPAPGDVDIQAVWTGMWDPGPRAEC